MGLSRLTSSPSPKRSLGSVARTALVAALLGTTASKDADAQQSTPPALAVTFPAAPADICLEHARLSDSRVRGLSDMGILSSDELRCLATTPDQLRLVSARAWRALPATRVVCVPLASVDALGREQRDIWNGYPRTLSAAQIANLTPTETRCFLPRHISMFTDEQWNSLSVFAKASIPLPEQPSSVISDVRRQEILAARTRSPEYAVTLGIRLAMMRRELDAARAFYHAQVLDPSRFVYLYNFASQLISATTVPSRPEATLAPEQEAAINSLFNTVPGQRYGRLPVSAGFRLNTANCGSDPTHCTIAQRDFDEIFALITVAANRINMVLGRTGVNLEGATLSEVRNKLAILNALRARFETVRSTYTSWGSAQESGPVGQQQNPLPVVGPRVNVVAQNVHPEVSQRVETTRVTPVSFWPSVVAGGLSLMGSGIATGVALSAESDYYGAIAACRAESARTNRPCDASYIPTAEDAYNTLDAARTAAVVLGGVAVAGGVLATVFRPRTVSTPVTQVTSEGHTTTPHPRQPNAQGVVGSAPLSFGVQYHQGGAVVNVGGQF